MSLKPEQVSRTRHTSPGARRFAKKAATRVMRRAVKQDPENAPQKRIIRGWAD